jgi:hypothetical protein
VTYGTSIDLTANLKDIWNTLFWPTALLILARTTRIFERGTAVAVEDIR